MLILVLAVQVNIDWQTETLLAPLSHVAWDAYWQTGTLLAPLSHVASDAYWQTGTLLAPLSHVAWDAYFINEKQFHKSLNKFAGVGIRN